MVTLASVSFVLAVLAIALASRYVPKKWHWPFSLWLFLLAYGSCHTMDQTFYGIGEAGLVMLLLIIG